jgi:septum formation protein
MSKTLPFRLVLASSSIGRRELLERAGYDFDIVPANIDEPTGEDAHDPRQLVQHIAWLKAAAVARRVDDGVLLAADTLGWHNGHPVGKPADEADARRILRMLAGTEHELWTGVCLWRRPDDIQVAWQEVSMVAVRPISDGDMDNYIRTRTWEGCSGAYAIEKDNDPYVRVVRGSVTNVIGLPMETLERVLEFLKLAGSRTDK